MYDIEKYYNAGTVSEAVTLLNEHPDTRIISGGSDVLIKIREGRMAGTSLVSIRDIEELKGIERKENGDIYIGAGTVKKKEEIDVLSDMGVPYILTPGFDEQIVRYALEKKIEVLPGVLTPSEVQAAVNCGIHLAKLFPADAFSDRYIKALKGPFPEMDYVAVGGVTPENAVNFYRLGYKGVAAGSNLVPKHAKRSDLKKIRETARKYVEVSQI